MNDAIQIKISKSEGGKTVVSARELHAQLKIETPFMKWFSRMCEYGFIKNQDYAEVSDKKVQNPVGGRPSTDYAITIDMAKELCMIQRTPIGKQCRNYFIECERKLKETGGFAIPQTYSQALALAAQQAEQIEQQQKQLAAQNQQLTEQKPKVEFYDMAMKSDSTKTVQEVAKTFGLPNHGRNTIFKILRLKGILDANNQPYQKYVDLGYFKLVQVPRKIRGRYCVFTQTVVFQRGMQFIKNVIERYKYDVEAERRKDCPHQLSLGI